MSFINWGNETPEQREIRRRIDEQALYEQAIAIRLQSMAAMGGGSKTSLSAKVISARHVAVWYNDPTTGSSKFFVVNYEDLSFSDEIVLTEDYTQLDSGPSFREMVNGRGWLVRYAIQDEYTYFFIDAGGNLIEKVSFTGARNDYSFDGGVSAFSYTDPNSGLVTLKWWDGTKIFTKKFADVDSPTVFLGWFNWDSNTEDGTFSIYYYDSALLKWRTYLVKANTGELIEITDLLQYKGESNYDNGMCWAGNYTFVTFQTQDASSSTASYSNGDDFITLSSPNTGIRIGDAISGSSIDNDTYVINIAGPIITLSKPVTGDETSVTVDFSGRRMDLLRIIKTDGTHIDYDLLDYHQWSTDNVYMVGSNKLILMMYPQTPALPDALLSFAYDGVEANLDTYLRDKSTHPNYDVFNSSKLYPLTGYQNSPLGSESFCMIAYNDSGYDGTMNRFSPLTVIWTDTVTGKIYTWDAPLGVVDFNAPPGILSGYAEGNYTVPVVNGVGFAGTGATIEVTINSSGEVQTIGVATPGSGYKVGDQMVILGNLLGGTTPITLTVTQVETFGLSTSNDGLTSPALFYVNSPASDKLQLLKLDQTGENPELIDLVTDYADSSSYYSVSPLGDDYILFTHYDGSQAPTVQFWGVWNVGANRFVDGTWFWTTTNNYWNTNYDTFWMVDNSENRTYWWNRAQGDLDNIPTTLGTGSIGNGSYRADDNDGCVYVDYHQTGTTLIAITPTEAYLLSSNFTPPALIDISGEVTVIRLNSTHFYNLRQDSGNGNKYVVDVYDLEGSLTQSVETSLDSYNSFYTVDNRVYLSQQDGSSLIIHAISPTDYITKTITKQDWGENINDWKWW